MTRIIRELGRGGGEWLPLVDDWSPSMPDSRITLHVDGKKEPYYIPQRIKKKKNSKN